MISQNTPNKLNRRKWLRDAAIATTSAAVLPSLLTGCTDHPVNPGSGLGSVPPGPPRPPLGSIPGLTPEELKNAHDNLINMVEFARALYDANNISITGIFDELKGDPVKGPPSFTELIIDTISEVLTASFEIAVEAIPGLGPVIGAAMAVATKGLNVWIEEKQNDLKTSGKGLNSTVGDFVLNYKDIQSKMTRALDEQAGSSADNYYNLREKWTDVELNGKTYTLRQLAQLNFPSYDKNSPTRTQFDDLVTKANLGFEQYFWRALIIQCGLLNSSIAFTGINTQKPGGAVGFARDVIYKTQDQIPTYTTGSYRIVDQAGTGYFYFTNWYFTFDFGVPLSESAAKILFKDDTPGHIINPKGLWPRDYVFKQFHKEKPNWNLYVNDAMERDLGTEAVQHSNPADDFGGLLRDYKFTGGK
ncbi:MAG: hypothetical protein JWP57_1922 [Spirosoma sp.]|nr:hypothetical protein [Spirosoma sp.]